MTTRTLDLADGEFGDLPTDFTYLLHLVADFSADDYDRALRVNAEGTGFVLEHCREREGGAGDVDGHRVQAAPRSVAPVPGGRPAGRRDGTAVGAVLGEKIAEEGVARYCARVVRPADRPSPAWARRTATRAACRSGTSTRSPRGSRCTRAGIPMTYSPIHDDDICAHLEPLLDAATVPATIVNWAGDEPVSVQEYSAFFGELLGVEPRSWSTEIPGASRRFGGRPHQAHVDHRTVQRSAGATGSGAWPSTSIPIGCGADVADRYPDADIAARRRRARRPGSTTSAPATSATASTSCSTASNATPT